jgi:hypothetical protein
MASLFCEDGNVIGFDGSQMNGQIQIKSETIPTLARGKTICELKNVTSSTFHT